MRTSRMGVAAAAVAMALVIGALPVAQAADEPANVIKYRRNVMKGIGANIANIAMVAKGEVSFAANVPLNARAIRDGVGLIGGLFPAGTETGDTNALAKLWQDRAGFEKAARDVLVTADAMVVAADSGDIGEIRTALQALGKTCGACHKPFRKEQ